MYVQNNDGNTPFELISNPKLIVEYLMNGTLLTYSFKPGSVQQFIWFCKSIDAKQLGFILGSHSSKIKWEHKQAISCRVKEQIMIHLPSHPSVWLLMKVCFHSHARNEDLGLDLSKNTYKKLLVIDIVSKLTDSSFTGNETNEELLHNACKTNNYYFVKHLILTLKCNTNCVLSEETTIEVTNNSEIMQLLIQHGAKVQPNHIEKLFLFSTQENALHPDTFRHMRETRQWYPDLACNFQGDTALHLTARYSSYEVACYMLFEAECDPNMRNLNNETPIHSLLTSGCPDPKCIDMLNIWQKTKQWYPNSCCNGNGDTVLHLSIRHHRYEVTQYLISEVKCNPNSRNLTGETQVELMISADKCWSDTECTDIIESLIATEQWDPNSKCNSNEDTILHLSVKYHRCAVLYHMLSQCKIKCFPHKRNLTGETVVQLMMSTDSWSDSECIEIIKTLIASKRWDPKSPCNSNGDTILHLSVKYHRYAVVHHLLSHCKCYPNIKNSKGETVFQVMMSTDSWSDSECVEIINALIKTKHWDPKSKISDFKCDTILHLSVLNHRYKVAQYLLSKVKCNPNIRNQNGKTPIQLVIEMYEWSDSECIGIIKELLKTKQWNPYSIYYSTGDTILHLQYATTEVN